MVPDYSLAWNNIGSVYQNEHKPELARSAFLKALSIYPYLGLFRSNLAAAYGEMGSVDSALYWYRQALELNPKDAESYHSMGKIYGSQMNNLNTAIAYMVKAINMDSGVAVFYGDLGLAYNLTGRPDDAIHTSEQCLQKFPDYIPAFINLGVAYRNKKDIQKAEEYEAKVSAMSKTLPDKPR